MSPRGLVAVVLVAACVAAAPVAQVPQTPGRVAVTVTPDRPDWTCQPGAPVKFRIDVLRDGHQVSGASVRYVVGPETMPPVTQATVVVGTAPLMIDGGTMTEPGFLRLVATAEVDGRTYRGLGTAGFSPERIQPTQSNPPGGDSPRREMDAASRLRDVPCGVRANQSSKCRAYGRHEPAVRRALHATRPR